MKIWTPQLIAVFALLLAGAIWRSCTTAPNCCSGECHCAHAHEGE